MACLIHVRGTFGRECFYNIKVKSKQGPGTGTIRTEIMSAKQKMGNNSNNKYTLYKENKWIKQGSSFFPATLTELFLICTYVR